MKKTIVLCDACNRQENIGEGAEFSVYLGRQMDAAGSMESTSEVVALCHHCCIRILKNSLQPVAGLPIPLGISFLLLVKKMRAEAK